MSETTEVVTPVKKLVVPTTDDEFEDDELDDEDEDGEVDFIPPSRNDLAELFEQWNLEDSQGDPEEQRQSWELLKRLLDEDRMGYRLLFPK